MSFPSLPGYGHGSTRPPSTRPGDKNLKRREEEERQERVKCSHCGQYGQAKTTCAHCGAPIGG